MLCAATLDLNDYSDTASLQQALASLPHMPAEVLHTKPYSGPYSEHNICALCIASGLSIFTKNSESCKVSAV